MLRASSYNIYVDLPDNSREMLIVQGYTGAYDKVSLEVGTFVRQLENYERPKPLFGKWSDEQLGKFNQSENLNYQPSVTTLDILKRRGYLTDLTFEEEEKTLSRIANTLHENSKKPSYMIMPTYNCNLRCPYCFQDHMRTDRSFSHLLRTMTTDMADRIIAVMMHIEKSKGWKKETPPPRRIGFFGGEPLLKITRPVVGYIIETAQRLGEAHFYAVTNGTDLHHYRELLGPDKIDYVQITLDGPPEEHDKRRIYPSGKGSFEVIANNVSMALDAGVRVSLRMNIDRNNVSSLPILAEEFISRGWSNHKFFGSYTAPIHNSTNKISGADTFNSYELDVAIDRLRDEFPDTMHVVGKPDEPLTAHVREIFHKKSTPSLKSTFCGAHDEMFIFDAFGDIYACWEVTGDKKVRIGQIKEEGGLEIAEDLYQMWRKRNVSTNPVCSKCRYALHCGGGCAVYANQKNGTMFSNFCDAFGKRFNSTVADTYQKFANGAEFVEQQERICDL